MFICRALQEAKGSSSNSSSKDSIRPYVVNGLKGLLRAISLGNKKLCASVMQDLLCVLHMWFAYGEIHEVAVVLEAGVTSVHLVCVHAFIPFE